MPEEYDESTQRWLKTPLVIIKNPWPLGFEYDRVLHTVKNVLKKKEKKRNQTQICLVISKDAAEV